MSAVNNWIHDGPKKYYEKCVEMFGKPTAVSNKKHGFAFWKTKGLFSEHLLRDEYVSHCVPRHHFDYFYSSVRFFIPKERVMDVLKISGSINYDGLKKLLTARCASIGANYATLYLGLMVGSGKMTIEQVKKGDLYAKHIRGEAKTHEQMRVEMIKMKRANNKKYKKEIKQKFATYAFSRCYKPKAANKTRKKTGLVGKNLKNTRNRKCSSKKSTACCPHMPPDNKERYAATNEMTVLKYRGKKYELHTCCKMCGSSMNRLAASNPDRFKKIYISRFNKRGDIIAKNKHTDKEIQILKLIK